MNDEELKGMVVNNTAVPLQEGVSLDSLFQSSGEGVSNENNSSLSSSNFDVNNGQELSSFNNNVTSNNSEVTIDSVFHSLGLDKKEEESIPVVPIQESPIMNSTRSFDTVEMDNSTIGASNNTSSSLQSSTSFDSNVSNVPLDASSGASLSGSSFSTPSFEPFAETAEEVSVNSDSSSTSEMMNEEVSEIPQVIIQNPNLSSFDATTNISPSVQGDVSFENNNIPQEISNDTPPLMANEEIGVAGSPSFENNNIPQEISNGTILLMANEEMGVAGSPSFENNNIPQEISNDIPPLMENGEMGMQGSSSFENQGGIVDDVAVTPSIIPSQVPETPFDSNVNSMINTPSLNMSEDNVVSNESSIPAPLDTDLLFDSGFQSPLGATTADVNSFSNGNNVAVEGGSGFTMNVDNDVLGQSSSNY